MIPTYEPGAYLLQALHSVLDQDLGSDRMQISLVDDGSKRVDVAQLLAEAKLVERVGFIQGSSNIGLAGNWNRCIQHARGELVHILHQDDRILPGFYSALCTAMMERASIGMAFSGCAFIDDNDAVTEYARRESRHAGIIPDWIAQITKRNGAHCASVIVRRRVYEKLGGYRYDLKYALDWEMWVRIAASFEVWHDPTVLACYRRHSTNETARLGKLQETHQDELRAVSIFVNHLPTERRARLAARVYARITRSRIRKTAKLLRNHQYDEAGYLMESAYQSLEPLPNTIFRTFYASRLALLRMKLAYSKNN